jgi:hypothetical protein
MGERLTAIFALTLLGFSIAYAAYWDGRLAGMRRCIEMAAPEVLDVQTKEETLPPCIVVEGSPGVKMSGVTCERRPEEAQTND